ncbi:alcohol dehydrogenase-like 3 isoform X3 [Lycium ferocissimum]|uniref:alcohol dehydrogenase-like 3 isoform X3 n=1 Tax=Lycium ferocissimum TaxID=112874 RepID=UPI0028166853|nr:alcohol dehydrogenase-like 3 isoform X3 [Lycium ferocissimum]
MNQTADWMYLFEFNEKKLLDSALSSTPFKMSWSRCCLENSKCGTRFNSSYLWFGCNWVAEGARLCGATRIIGVDINSDKFEIGKQFGVTEFVNSKSCGDKPVSQMLASGQFWAKRNQQFCI